jgi:hypothetical protein
LVAVYELMDTESCACLCLHTGYVKSSSCWWGGGEGCVFFRVFWMFVRVLFFTWV